MAAKQFHYAWEWRLAATPSALWPLVSDTNRFNRDAGVPAVAEQAGSRPGTRQLSLRKYGVLVEWEEEPFEWIRPRSFGVVRRYAKGPVAEMRVRVELQPDSDEHTKVRYSVTAVPRNALGYIAIPFEIGIVSAQRFESVFRRYAQEARAAAPERAAETASIAYLARPARLAQGAHERIERIRTQLSTRFPNSLVDRLIELITRADDLAVIRIRPYLLADIWKLRRRDVLDLCLHATRAGLLDLQWDVLCLLCRGAKQSNTSLQGISQPVHCDACNIDFNANFEQAVELTFRPTAAIRPIEVFPYCVGGPQLTPHIVLQQLLQPGEMRTVRPELEPGRYRIRASGLAGGQLFRIAEQGSACVSLCARAQGWPNDEILAGSSADCALANETDSAQLLIVERMAWSDQALTAAEVIALQEFRDLFASEALRPGEAISVGSVTIMFTDLLGSTRLYREMGDAPAFGRVMNHFDALKLAVKEEEGAIVKTIGDAVMAVFRRPASAIRTILRAQQLLAEAANAIDPMSLKAGVHFGPCIAVTQNERLDYFGSTVNIAARLGAASQGADIVVSDAVANDPEVQSLLQLPGITATRFEKVVKGYDDTPLQLLRITVAATK